MSITRSDGGAFGLNAVDIGNYYDDDACDSPAQPVFVVEAKRTDGNIVSRIIMLDDIPNHESGRDGDFNQSPDDAAIQRLGAG